MHTYGGVADIVGKVQKTALGVLRRAIALLAEGLDLGERLAGRLSSQTRSARPSAATARRQRPLNHEQEQAGGKGAGDATTGHRERAAAPRRAAEGHSVPLPEGHLVARVAGEEEVFEAPLPLVEEKLPPPASFAPGPPPLPTAYRDDTFVALARDPFTLWLYWDFAPETVQAAMSGLRSPRTKLRIYQGEHRVRDMDFALESGSYYINDLSPGERYQAEIVFVGDQGERRLGRRSNAVALPNFGPSGWAEDRFATLPWEAKLPKGLDAFERPLPPELEDERYEPRAAMRRGASEAWPRRRPEAGSQVFIGRGARREGR